ncbi:MAG: MFS transporter [Streptosporangiales bacterium]|nr:MFS transporter [Streptosporangiales bacterium]
MADHASLTARDEAQVSRSHWRPAILAATASYFDAGAIVAGAVALPLWAEEFSLGTTAVGLIGAFSANGISTGIGALVGGYLGDRFGRRVIYTWDLLLYIVGVLVIVFAPSAGIVILGYVLTGFAAGADIPNSMSLLAEIAPRKSRSKIVGLAPVLWYLGPLVVTGMSVAMHSLGLLGARIIFAHLAVVALVVWILRRSMVESPRWTELKEAARESQGATARSVRTSRSALKAALPAFVFMGALVTVWNIPAGTYGFFFPYLLRTAGAHSAFAADFLNMMLFVIGIITLTVFLFIGDRVNRRVSYAVFSAVAALGFFLFLFLFMPVTSTVAVVLNLILMGVGGFSVTFHLWSVWSTELFATNVRASAQGWTIAVSRVALGLWSLALPAITGTFGFTTVAVMLGCMYVFGVVFGGLFGPSTQGKSLEQIRFSWSANFRSSG